MGCWSLSGDGGLCMEGQLGTRHESPGERMASVQEGRRSSGKRSDLRPQGAARGKGPVHPRAGYQDKQVGNKKSRHRPWTREPVLRSA